MTNEIRLKWWKIFELLSPTASPGLALDKL